MLPPEAVLFQELQDLIAQDPVQPSRGRGAAPKICLMLPSEGEQLLHHLFRTPGDGDVPASASPQGDLRTAEQVRIQLPVEGFKSRSSKESLCAIGVPLLFLSIGVPRRRSGPRYEFDSNTNCRRFTTFLQALSAAREKAAGTANVRPRRPGWIICAARSWSAPRCRP